MNVDFHKFRFLYLILTYKAKHPLIPSSLSELVQHNTPTHIGLEVPKSSLDQ